MCASRTKPSFLQTVPFFAVKVLPRFGIAAVDKAVDIVAYQAGYRRSVGLAADCLRLRPRVWLC